MDKQTQLMFALQSPIGLRFGATQSVDAERITFEMDVVLDKGVVCPFRMELTGLEDTVMGDVRIERVLPKRQGSLPRFVAKIIEMPDVDRRAFDGWRRDQATGGISRRVERDPESIKQQISDQMRGSTDAEARVVLDKMNAKSIYKRKSADRIEGDPFGLDHESEENSRADQDTMRQQLRDSASALPEDQPRHEAAAAPPATATSDGGAQTPSLPTPPPAVSASTAGDPEWLRPVKKANLSASSHGIAWLEGGQETAGDPAGASPSVIPPPAAQVAEPEVAEPEVAEPTPPPAPAPPAPEPAVAKPITQVDAGQQPVHISITYLSVESLAADYAAGLRSSALTVQDSALETLYLPVEIRITLPDSRTIECMGQTVARTSSGTAVAMELDSKQRKLLAEVAEG